MAESTAQAVRTGSCAIILRNAAEAPISIKLNFRPLQLWSKLPRISVPEPPRPQIPRGSSKRQRWMTVDECGYSFMGIVILGFHKLCSVEALFQIGRFEGDAKLVVHALHHYTNRHNFTGSFTHSVKQRIK